MHCVQESTGAEFPNNFPIHLIDIDIRKGTDPAKEAYSGFEGTDLLQQLEQRNIKRLFAFGLTTEYCVFASATDSIQNGFETFVIHDLMAEVQPESKDKKLEEMKEKGIKIISQSEISL